MNHLIKTFSKESFKTISLLSLFVFFFFIHSPANGAEKSKSCAKEKLEFKKLFLELQAQFLNYEGRDTKLDDKGNIVLDAKGNVILVPHAAGKPYEGKVFEAAVYSQYQNALKKVGKLVQASKFAKDNKENEELQKSYPELVRFLKAIEGGDTTSYIQDSKIGDVLIQLQKASAAKFNTEETKKFAINDDDKYLLQKLLTHAQDRLCSVESYERNNKGTALFTAPYLKKVREAPLNRLIGALKGAKLTADSELLVDTQTAISSAIAEHMDKLGKWMQVNKACRKFISDPNFLQANVQSCNYNKFLDVLEGEKLDRFQAVLHFINANERLLNRPQAKAETALDELLLESTIDSAFANLGNRIGCTQIEGPNKSKRIFVRNLPYKDNKFDTSGITCKLNKKVLSQAECSNKIEFVSDEFGRGLEMKQKKGTGASVTFSVTQNPDCSDLDPGNPPTPRPLVLTNEICADRGKKETPPRELILSADKLSCIEKPVVLTSEICADRGKKETPPRELILSADKLSCIEKPVVLTDEICADRGKKETPPRELKLSEDKLSCVEKPVVLTNEICAEQGKKETPPRVLMLSDDTLSCVEKPVVLTSEICADRGKKETPPRELILSDDKLSCIEKPVVLTSEICADQGKKATPPKDLVLSEDKKSCIERKIELSETVCAEKGKNDKPPKKLTFDKDKKICVNSDELACNAKNEAWKKANNTERGGRYIWNPTKNNCDDTKPDPKAEEEEKEEVDRTIPIDQTPKNPQIFRPTPIPTRQPQMLPWMP